MIARACPRVCRVCGVSDIPTGPKKPQGPRGDPADPANPAGVTVWLPLARSVVSDRSAPLLYVLLDQSSPIWKSR